VRTFKNQITHHIRRYGVPYLLTMLMKTEKVNVGASAPTFLLSVETFVTCNYKFTTTKSDDHAFNGMSSMPYYYL